MAAPPTTNSPSSSGTSLSLISGLRRRDAAAWERLVRLYSPLVVHWFQRWRIPPREIADLLQEVFRAVARRVPSYRHDRPGDTFRGWLRQIALNKTRDYYRRAEREPQPVGGSEALAVCQQIPDHPETEIDDIDDAEENVWRGVLRAALESVRSDCQPNSWQAFWQTVVEGKSVADAATELNMTPGAVRVAKCRMLRRLREVLGDSLD